MITLMNWLAHPFPGQVDVYLDVTPTDFAEFSDPARKVMSEAKTNGRKVGCILRQFGGQTFFSYDLANQLQLEIALLSALAVPKTDVHVTENAGGNNQWRF